MIFLLVTFLIINLIRNCNGNSVTNIINTNNKKRFDNDLNKISSSIDSSNTLHHIFNNFLALYLTSTFDANPSTSSNSPIQSNKSIKNLDDEDYNDEDEDLYESDPNSNDSEPDAKHNRKVANGEGGDSSDEKDDTWDDVDDISNDDFSNPVDDNSDNSNTKISDVIKELKVIWKEFILPPMSLEAINKVKADYQSSTPLSSRANGTEEATLHNHLLVQFMEPVAYSGRRAMWMDQEFSLLLKGMAVLAQHPEMMPSNVSGGAKLSKAIRLVASSGKSLAGTQRIQFLLVKALAASLQSNLVHLNQRTIEAVRERALVKLIPRKLITKSVILSALFELTEEVGSNSHPFLLLLHDKMSWLVNNQECSELFLEELKSPTSRIFVINMEQEAGIKAGLIPPIFSNPNSESTQTSQPVPNGLLNSQFPNGFPFLPPPPPGMVIGRSFQVVVQNGTATMIPLPPGMIPSPPPELIKKFMADQHKHFLEHMQQQGKGDASNNPQAGGLFPPDMSEEDLQEYLQDPENQAKIKEMIEAMVGNLAQGVVENIKVHMMAMPPPPFTEQPQPPQSEQVLPEQTETKAKIEKVAVETPKLSNKKTKGNVEKKEKSKSIPGLFFRGLRSKDASKEVNNANVKVTSSRNYPNVDATSDVDEQSPTSDGDAILSSFEDIILEPPRDHTLSVIWDKLVDEEVGSRVIRVNRKLINLELRRLGLRRVPGSLRSLDNILSKRALTKDEVRQALIFALKLQAGKCRVDDLTALSYSVDSTSVGLDEQLSKLIQTTPTSIEVNENEPNNDFAGSSLLILSSWALDSAFSTVVKAPSPRLGKPITRSKEEISALATDKHEKALSANVISPNEISVTYDMIGGLDEVKEMLRQCITYPLKYPRLYSEGVASEAVKGVLLFGPPGTGKTMLAKAVATEGGATFLTIDTSTIENKWLGESEKNARAVFTLARKLAPCVIYLDEVDSILSSREHGDDTSHGTLTSVKTTLMQEWDGLRTTKDRVVVIASTNRPFDLDEAVLRRLPRRIMVDLPDIKTRAEIIAVTLAGNRIAPEVNLTTLAQSLEGYTGSDIKEVCREAVVRVCHERAQTLEMGGILSSNNTIQKNNDVGNDDDILDPNAPLRPVTMSDFKSAMKKLKASVDDNGRELQKVIEWNDKYGEMKRVNGNNKKSSGHLNMYI
eukprot:gene8477-11459_t